MNESGPVGDRYRRIEILGEGGAARVWLVEDRLRPGSRLALKVPIVGGPAAEEAIRREFVMLTRLRHPGLVEPHDFDCSPETGDARFTLEYVEGEGLGAAGAREGPDLLLEMAAEALRVLAFLHDFELIHRDLKPANLLVRRRPRLGWRLVLLDLGLARIGQPDPGSDPAGLVGTLPFLAPELFGGTASDRRSDLYGLGAVFHDAVYGRPPYLPQGNDLAGFVDAVRAGRRAAGPLPEGYPPGLAAWLDELLAPDPAQRPAGAREALALLNRACGRRFPVDTAASRAARLASDPPAGRESELRRAWSHLEQATGPCIVWLTGPAGSGKSRILRWLRTEAILRGWRVLSPPFPPRGGDATGTAGLLGGLGAEAAGAPAFVLLDDVESAEGALARGLERIARDHKGPPLRVVAALRSEEGIHPILRRLLEDTETVPTLHRVALSPLGAAGIRELVRRATGGGEPSEARLRWLTRASEGNPLLVEALLVEGVWEKGGRGPRSGALDRSVTARLDLLSDPGRSWLEALAVLGAGTGGDLVATLAELPPATARDSAEEVRACGLACADWDRWSPEPRWVAELVLRRIEGDRSAALHRQAAELLLAPGSDRAEPWRLARLWSAAGRPRRAAVYAMRAARLSETAGDPAEAAERWESALRHYRRHDSKRLLMRTRQAESRLAAGHPQAAARAYGAALRLARSDAGRADLLGRQAHALVQAGRFARARAAADEALALAEDGNLRRERAWALKAVALVLGRLGQEREALDLFQEALEIFHAESDAASEAETRQNLATCKIRLQRADAEADYLAAIELWRQLGRRGSELKSWIGLAVIHMRAGRLDEAERLLEDVRRTAVEHGHLDLLEVALSRLASVAIEKGRLDHALALSREALDQARHLGLRNPVLVGQCRVGEALIGCGRPAQAAELLREALGVPLEQVEPDVVGSARMLLASALLEMPSADDDEVATLLENSLDGFRRRRKTRELMMALVIELERRSRPGKNRPLEPVLMEYEALSRGSDVELEPEIRVRAELARAAWLLASGNPAGAREAAAGAASLARDSRLGAHAARAHGLLSQALAHLGDAEQAKTALAAGARLLEDAAGRIDDPVVRQSFLDRALFRSLRQPETETPGGGDRRLLALYEMIRALNSETDPDALLESILDMALGAVSAERGMIFLHDPVSDDFAVRLARNLEQETERDAESFSRRIVARAGAGRSILALDTGQDERFRDLASVSLYGIRSLMCVPLRSRGRIIGTVYLDSRLKGCLFRPEDLRFVEAFADHAALALENARERAALLSENRRLQTVAETRAQFGNLVGRSPGMQQVYQLIEKVADSALPVLIRGDSGTGKELVARAIHFNGPRRRKIFLSENCAAIPDTLLETELFGHVRGAFTGAERERRGLFEQADGGTLFLDEVGDMSPSMQARLLRALQEGEIRRVGADRPVRVDVRVLAATHRELAGEVAAGRFREDLLYRLQVLVIRLPALRDRVEDIPLLVDHLLAKIARERGRAVPQIAPPVRDLLLRCEWPGNVRQLENTLQRLVLLAGAEPISLREVETDETFRKVLFGSGSSDRPVFSLDRGIRDELRRALAATGGNRARAADLLGISRATIYRKIKELDLR